MITDDHTQSSAEQLLNTVRIYERKLFGCNNTPIQINSDRSLVLLQASMNIFKKDTMSTYLNRCWHILNGTQKENDLDFCIIRSCKSHLMRQASDICKKQYSGKDSRYRIGMYMFRKESLLWAYTSRETI